MINTSSELPATPRRTITGFHNTFSDEAVVGGVIGPVCEPSALVLGRYDSHSRLRVAGRTAPLRDADRVVLGQLLQGTDEHPWPATLRARFGEHRPLAYIRVRPDVVVELDVDTACDHGVWRHPALYRRPRTDLRPSDLVPV